MHPNEPSVKFLEESMVEAMRAPDATAKIAALHAQLERRGIDVKAFTARVAANVVPADMAVDNVGK